MREPPPFQWRMALPQSPAAHERELLVQFEALYEQLLRASEALARAEVALWTQAVRDGGGAERQRLAGEALRLRDAARAAQGRVRAALTSCR